MMAGRVAPTGVRPQVVWHNAKTQGQIKEKIKKYKKQAVIKRVVPKEPLFPIEKFFALRLPRKRGHRR